MARTLELARRLSHMLRTFLLNVVLFLINFLSALPLIFVIRKPKSQSAVAYKGTLPRLPKAVAVVWAEEAVNDNALKQFADILQWCDHGQLETFCIFDPKGALKARSDTLQLILSNKSCSLKVGWSHTSPGSRISCAGCRQKSCEGSGRGCTSFRGWDDGRRQPREPTPGVVPTQCAAGSALIGPRGLSRDACPRAAAGAVATHAPGEASALSSLRPACRQSAGLTYPPITCDAHVRGCGLRHTQAAATTGNPSCRSSLQHDPPEQPWSDTAGSMFCTGVIQPGCLSAEARTGSLCDACAAGLVSERQADAASGCSSQRAGASRQTLPCGPCSKPPLHAGDQAHQERQAGCRQGQKFKGLSSTGPEHLHISGGRVVSVHVLSAEDGYSPVLQAARSGGVCSACNEVVALKEGPYREGLSRLRHQLVEIAGPAVLIQPELVLVVGPYLTLAGFPPLQVATSEILHLGPSRKLCKARVDAAIAKFLRTEQRFGR